MKTQIENMIAAHQKTIAVLSMIEKAENRIKSSEPYLSESRSHTSYFSATSTFHKKNISRYTKIKDRLVVYYSNLNFRVFHMELPPISTPEFMLPF